MSETSPHKAVLGLSRLPLVTIPGPMNKRNMPKNGISNREYAAKHNITPRQASKKRRSERFN